MDVVIARTSVHVSNGVLVHRGVGLGRGIVRRRDAVAGLTTVIAVSVVYSAVGILVLKYRRRIKHTYVVVSGSEK